MNVCRIEGDFSVLIVKLIIFGLYAMEGVLRRKNKEDWWYMLKIGRDILINEVFLIKFSF